VGNLGQLVLSKESAFVHCKQMAVFPLPHGRGERGESILNISIETFLELSNFVSLEELVASLPLTANPLIG
jgi:hypothetical protein